MIRYHVHTFSSPFEDLYCKLPAILVAGDHDHLDLRNIELSVKFLVNRQLQERCSTHDFNLSLTVTEIFRPASSSEIPPKCMSQELSPLNVCRLRSRIQ